jgi:hypothetical protein
VQPRPSGKNKSLDQLSCAPTNDSLPPPHPSAPAAQVESSLAEALLELLKFADASPTMMTADMLQLKDAAIMLDTVWKVSIILFDITQS